MKTRSTKKEDRLRDEEIMKALEEVAERLSVQIHYEEMKAFEFRVQDGSCRVKGESSIFIDRKRPLKEKISILAGELKIESTPGRRDRQTPELLDAAKAAGKIAKRGI